MLEIEVAILEALAESKCVGYVRRRLDTKFEVRITHQMVNRYIDRMQREGLIQSLESRTTKSQTYQLTEKGREQLSSLQSN